MPTDTARVYWDACVFLAYINGEEERLPAIDEVLTLARTKKLAVVTSTVSIVEVACAAQEQQGHVLDAEADNAISNLWVPGSPIVLVDFYGLIANAARSLMRQAVERGWQLKPMDAIHLATANHAAAVEFHTYDDKLFKYKELTTFLISEPQVAQLQLGT